MKYQKDAAGWYSITLAYGQVYKTRLCPVDGSTFQTWAESLIQRGQDAIDHGFGLCHDGTPYDLNNFLCDTLAGHMPWNDKDYKELFEVMVKLPNFLQVVRDFKAKYNDTYFHETFEQEKLGMEMQCPCCTLKEAA